LRRLRAAFRERLGRFDEFLLADVPLARQALRKLVAGRIEFRLEERGGERGYRLRWALATNALMDGNIGVASPRGFEPRLLQRRSAWQLLARVVERPLDNTREAAVI
jgi:hypothetical protein